MQTGNGTEPGLAISGTNRGPATCARQANRARGNCGSRAAAEVVCPPPAWPGANLTQRKPFVNRSHQFPLCHAHHRPQGGVWAGPDESLAQRPSWQNWPVRRPHFGQCNWRAEPGPLVFPEKMEGNRGLAAKMAAVVMIGGRGIARLAGGLGGADNPGNLTCPPSGLERPWHESA